ncbi:transposase family protein [Microbacterium halimionae]|uniref:transposase family protein n=1 Tax=Microbacterium halimionae TaxID=1526413 RepID=UPI001420FDC0|nr:transposase family protein [Microbacterium halimionae]
MPSLIVPESVTVDRGKVFIGSTFTAACERLEISQTRANPKQGTDKPHVESGFKRIREGFVQYFAGYTGGTISNRGDDPRAEAVWTLSEVQLLLDLWVILH